MPTTPMQLLGQFTTIESCDGDPGAARRALIIANAHPEAKLAGLVEAASRG